MSENPIYSKIDYPNAISARRNLLESQANLLRSLQHLENYKDLRKKEIVWKIKLKNNVKEVKESVSKILKHVPKTSGVKQIETEFREKQKKKKKESPVKMSVEAELSDIQRRLQELS